MYLPTPFNRVIALDPATGRQKWAFDPGIDRNAPGGDGFVCRGVSTWLDPQRAEGQPCRRRIFVATLDARLIALDAATGSPCADFGSGGQIRLGDNIGEEYRGEYHMTSPPVIVRDNVVVGSAMDDNVRVDMPSGVVRAFNARTGAQVWSWDPIPRRPGEPGRETWEGDSANKTGAANAWAPLSADPERDLVFIPTGSASVDHYGGERKGDDLFANSVVAIRGSTGKVVWYFQVVHHDTWDYDVPSQPSLITLNGTPAVVSAQKSGLIFTFHRETGVPIFPVEERPVPKSDVPGEQLSPTQPFPVAPPPLFPQKITAEDAWGVAYFDRQGCEARIKQFRSEGLFTPLSLQGSIESPGIAGGTNWGSVAYDPQRSYVIVNASKLPFVVGLAPREKLDELRRLQPKAEIGRMRGTPYVMWRNALLSEFGIPCVAPPWGLLTAVDMKNGTIKWQVPLGTIRDMTPVPLPIKTGTPNMGGPMVTAGGLIFIGAAMDNYLRAFDIDTGQELWKGRLPAGGQATPMTYAANGKQYVVIAAGGHGKMGTKLGDSVVAFALP
jgi:quinoprotein glucose dehydrogenase